MSRNGTDRDVAKLLLDALNAIKDLVATIKSNLYSPLILTQPVDVVGAIDDPAVYTVLAANVSSYQWQYAYASSPNTWVDSSLTGYDTNTLSMTITSSRYNLRFRCKITGLDGTVVYSDVVKCVAPET